jgi:hypothetical protein
VSVASFLGTLVVGVALPDAIDVVVTGFPVEGALVVVGDFTEAGGALVVVGDLTVVKGALVVVVAAARAGIDSAGGDVVGTETAGLRGTFELSRSPAPN